MSPKTLSESPTVVIEATSPTEMRRFISKVIPAVTRSRMQALAMLFSPLFGSRNVKMSVKISQSTADAVYKLISGATPPSLEATRDAFATLFCNPTNVRNAYDALPSTYRVVIDAIMERIYVSASFIKTTVDTRLEKVWLLQRNGKPAESYATSERLYDILQRIGSSYRTECYSIEGAVLNHMGAIIGKGLYARTEGETVEELPDIAGLRRFSCADSYISMLSVINDAFQKNELTVTSTTGIVKSNSMKMFALTYPAEEFFPKAPVRQMRDVRMRTILSFFYAAYTRRTSYSNPTPELLAKLHADFSMDSYGRFSLALPWIGGLRKGLFESANYSQAYKELLNFFRDRAETGKSGPWYDAQSVARKILVMLPTAYKFGFNVNMREYNSYDLVNGADNTEINRINLVDSVGLPGLLGMMVNMCATGLLEMAVTQPVEGQANPYTCVRYVRLSAFGRYAFGIDNEYHAEITAVETQVQCELDPDRLIITALSPSAVNAVKANFGIAIGAGRFAVTPEAIFRKAPDAFSLSQQKDRLLTLAGLKTLPPLWEEFFDSLKLRYVAIHEESILQQVYYSVNPGCPGLVEAITSDPEIRDLVSLVEGNGFLVHRDDVARLRGLLKEHGFLLPQPKVHYYYY